MTAWKPVARGLWVGEYMFNNAPIQIPVVDMGDGSLMVISPGVDTTDAAFDELDALGPVRALVTPGAFHHMGLPAWSARYPEVEIYGPEGAAKHIAGQQPDLKPLKGLNELRPLLSDEFVVDNLEGARFPDLFLVLRRDDVTTWFTNETISNARDYPASFVFRTVFKLFGVHPGLNINTVVMMLIRARKPEIKAYLQRRLQSDPPTRLVPCHGDVLEADDLPAQLAELVERRL